VEEGLPLGEQLSEELPLGLRLRDGDAVEHALPVGAGDDEAQREGLRVRVPLTLEERLRVAQPVALGHRVGVGEGVPLAHAEAVPVTRAEGVPVALSEPEEVPLAVAVTAELDVAVEEESAEEDTEEEPVDVCVVCCKRREGSVGGNLINMRRNSRRHDIISSGFSSCGTDMMMCGWGVGRF
jgi:hypothetical protein